MLGLVFADGGSRKRCGKGGRLMTQGTLRGVAVLPFRARESGSAVRIIGALVWAGDHWHIGLQSCTLPPLVYYTFKMANGNTSAGFGDGLIGQSTQV
jgi:hypothetical protein